MKTPIIALAFIVFPLITHAAFNSSLSYGMSNTSVLELQDFLYSERCFSVQPTGFFGSITLNAVKCFQRKYGIIDTGFFGVLSRTKANSLLEALLAPSIKDELSEAPTSPIGGGATTTTTPPTTVLTQPAQIIYLPANEPTQKIMPKLTGEIPRVTFSDNTYDQLTVDLTSDDFTGEELASITKTVTEVSNSMGKKRVPQISANIELENVPEKAGKIRVTVSAEGHSAEDLSPMFLESYEISPGNWGRSWRRE